MKLFLIKKLYEIPSAYAKNKPVENAIIMSNFIYIININNMNRFFTKILQFAFNSLLFANQRITTAGSRNCKNVSLLIRY
jgi:hypothetical protein